MKFVKQSFMGMELDILTGHPEHDILFIATQVARVSGLKIPSQQASRHARIAGHTQSIQFGSIQTVETLDKPKGVQATSWLFTEAATYQMLLRGHAPQSEPFRKWVTEEVLPSIRKTGKYNAEDSQNPIALAIMDELKSLRGEIVSLRQELQAKTFSLAAPVVPEISPYEGQAAVALCDPLGFNKRLYRELAESCLDRPAADKMEPRVTPRPLSSQVSSHSDFRRPCRMLVADKRGLYAGSYSEAQVRESHGYHKLR